LSGSNFDCCCQKIARWFDPGSKVILAVAAQRPSSWTGHARLIRIHCPAISHPFGHPETATGALQMELQLWSSRFYVGADEDGIHSGIAMNSFADVRKEVVQSCRRVKL